MFKFLLKTSPSPILLTKVASIRLRPVYPPLTQYHMLKKVFMNCSIKNHKIYILQRLFNCAADQPHCLCYVCSTITLLARSQILCLTLFSVAVQCTFWFVSDLVMNLKDSLTNDASGITSQSLCKVSYK